MGSTIPIPLSVGNIRALRNNLKEFARELRDDIPTDVEQSVCALIAEDIKANIASIPDVDGNYLGTDNPNASVVVEVALRGHETIWRGKQIAYVEFGTGAAGQGYPGAAMGMAGYHPDPTKKRWVYADPKLGAPVVSHGLAPMAPMYNASLAMRAGAKFVPARLILKEAVRRAITV